MADLSLLMYSLAVMRRKPNSQWLHDWLAATQRWGFAGANAQDLSIMLWALATLGLNPGEGWVKGFMGVTEGMLTRWVVINADGPG
jgi:hypothetical protein